MPNYELYENELKKLIDSAENAIDNDEMAKIISSAVYSYVLNNFNTSKGNFLLDSDAVKALTRFTNKLNESITSKSTYSKSVLNFLTKVKQIGAFQIDFFGKTQTKITANEVSVGQQIVIDELLQQYLENGLNEKLLEPVKRLLRRSILGKGKIETFSKAIKDLVPAELQRYNKTTIQAGVDGYQSVINKKLYEKYESKATHIRVTNTIIATSSPQCRMCVEDYNSEVPISAFPKIFKVAEQNGLIEGTTLKNLPINKLHWGCRHGFYPIIKV